MPRIAVLASLPSGIAAMLIAATAAAEPSATASPPAEPQPVAAELATAETATTETATTATATPAVPDATWSALAGRRVSIATAKGPIEGELASTAGSDLVVIADDGTVQTVPKADATGVKVSPRETSPTTADASPKGEPAAKTSEPDAKASEPAKEEGKRKREHALLGAFTAHGAAYANWRGAGVSAGHAAYLMDWGIGVNATPGFGMYAMAGGVLGARIADKTIRANYGHFALMFAFGGKYYHSMFGAGVGLSRLKTPTETQKDVGLSLPFKIFGKLPLPHHLYLGIGLSYELALVRDWKRYVNVIGGQIILGRW